MSLLTFQSLIQEFYFIPVVEMVPGIALSINYIQKG